MHLLYDILKSQNIHMYKAVAYYTIVHHDITSL